MEKIDIKFRCPICLDGRGKAKFTELSLEKHLDRFHQRVDASDLTDRVVSGQIGSFYHPSINPDGG